MIFDDVERFDDYALETPKWRRRGRQNEGSALIAIDEDDWIMGLIAKGRTLSAELIA